MTFLEKGQSFHTITSSTSWTEQVSLSIKNIISGAYVDATASFQKETFISSIGVYDKDRNLIGIAKVATPVQKREERNYMFKLKVDF